MATKPSVNVKKLIPSKPKAYDPAKQVEGYKQRFDAAGIPKSKTDSRNLIEKAFNVRPNQNVLFDIAEVIGRPQQAIVGGITAAQEGKDVLGEAFKGFTGQEYYEGKQIFKNMGAEDREGKIDMADIAGLGVDIFLDPLDLALWAAAPLTGGASAAISVGLNSAQAGFKALDKLGDLSRLAKTAGYVDTAKDLFKSGNEIARKIKGPIGRQMSDLLKQAATAKTAGRAKRLLSQFEDVVKVAQEPIRISTLQLGARGIKKVFGASIGFADDLIEKAFKGIDTVMLRTDPKFAKSVRDWGEKVLYLNNYQNFKSAVKGVFDSASSLPPGLIDEVRDIKGLQKIFEQEGQVLTKMTDELIDKVVSITKLPKEEASKLLLRTIELKDLNYTSTLKRQLTDTTAMRKIPMSAKEVARVKGFLAKYLKDETGKAYYTTKTISNRMFNRFTKNGVKYYMFNSNYVDDVAEAVEGLLSTAKRRNNKELLYVTSREFRLEKLYDKKTLKQIREFENTPGITRALNEAREIFRRTYKTLDRRAFSEYATTSLKNTRKGGVLIPRSIDESAKDMFDSIQEQVFKSQYLKGNTKVSADRIYRMSAFEANNAAEIAARNLQKAGMLSDEYANFFKGKDSVKLFSEQLNQSIADFALNKSRTSFQANTIHKIFAVQTFADEGLVSVYKGGGVPLGKSTVSRASLVKKLEDMLPYQSEKGAIQAAIDLIKNTKGDSLLIENNLLDLIALPKEVNGFRSVLDIVDKLNSFFKTTKLLSPGFHLRNIFGNLTNMLLAGVSPTALTKYTPDVAKMMTTGPELMERAVRAGAHIDPSLVSKIFTPEEARLYNILREYTAANLPQASALLYDYPEALELAKRNPEKASLIDKALGWNQQLNEKGDTFFRLNTFMYARDNPQLLKRLNLENPADLVRRAHFDPSDLSGAEKDYIKKLIPFYTFTKKNLAFQMDNIMKNPTNYRRLMTAFDGAWKLQDLDPYNGDVEEYKRTNFWLPIWKEENGKYVAVKLNLPVGDLAEFLAGPGRKTISSLTPAVRAPFELVTNQQVYSGLPIQDFKGQKGYNLEFLPRKLEYLVGQTGLDVPAGLVAGTIETGVQAATGQFDPLKAMTQGLGQSVASVGDAERGQRSAAYEELRRLQELMSFYKQEGVDVPTISDIENKNNSLDRLRKKLKTR